MTRPEVFFRVASCATLLALRQQGCGFCWCWCSVHFPFRGVLCYLPALREQGFGSFGVGAAFPFFGVLCCRGAAVTQPPSGAVWCDVCKFTLLE